LGAFDEDGNGFLGQEEFLSGEEFQGWDRDGDGAIPGAEFR
jgi:Ca2+-binding EF-hand superfamily protein